MQSKQRTSAKIDASEYPYWYYFKRNAWDIPISDINITTDDKDFYLLKRIWVKWPMHGITGPDDPATPAPALPIALEINYADQSRRLQNAPVSAQLTTSPCEVDFVNPGVNGLELAGQKKLSFTYNYLFDRNGTINIKVSWAPGIAFVSIPGGSVNVSPDWFHIWIEGRKIPERAEVKRTRSAGVLNAY